ncbi:MAG: amidohydrolase family protein [Planctomycetes bacterium]|nr:amidohydrolase family protein [Planctomycetota bacterium]
MIIDSHTYVGDSLLGYTLQPDELIRAMDKRGICAAVACPMKGLDPYYFEPNRYIARIQEQYPDRIIGFARVNPHLKSAAEASLETAFDRLGLRGLVLHPWEETFAINDPLVYPLVDMAVQRRLPIMLEAGYPILSHPLQCADLASRFPDGIFIMTHGGQLDSSGWSMTDAELVMRNHGNIVMNTAGLFADELLERLPGEIGIERLIFGSHSPWLNLDLELKRLERAHIDANVRAAILGGNAARMFGLAGER